MLMKNSTLKLLIVACLLFIAGQTHAQFSFSTNTNIGQVLTTDVNANVDNFVVDFNTARPLSSWEYVDSTDTYNVSVSKCQTQRGLQVNVYTSDTVGAPTIINKDFECRNFGDRRNPAHVANIDSLMSLLQKLEIKNAGTGDSLNDVPWKPSACLFDIDGAVDNQAFGCHPGIYKTLEYGFQFKFEGNLVSNDITFDVWTYNAGNTGMTATYSLTVATGSTSNIIGTVPDFYVTGSAKKSVSLAAAIGVDPSVFSNTKVYIFVKTMGTGTAIAEGTYDPTIVFDNFHASYDLAQWLTPAIGVVKDSLVDNSDDPATGIIGAESTYGIHIQDKDRFGALTITNDLQNKSQLRFTFLDSMSVMANDGSGNYTVPVDYTMTPATFNESKGEWSKAQIKIAAPESGTVDDDLMFYFKATPKSTMLVSDRWEITNGTRFRYDFYYKGVEPVAQEWNISDDAFNALGELAADTTVNGLTIYADDDKKVTIDDNNKSIGGMDFTWRLKLGGSARFTDGVPSARVLAFDVTGNTMITVAAMSSSSSSDRELAIAAGSEDNIIATFPAMGASIGKKDYYYMGGPTTIYMYSPSSGVNVYYIKATPLSMVASKVLYVGANPTDAVLPSDSMLVQSLKDAGDDVTYMDDNDAIGTFDYSPFDVVVFGESCSSSKVVPFGTESHYPIPSVILEPLAPRNGKWGWWDAASDASVYVDNSAPTGDWNYIDVTTTHYITSNHSYGDMFKYSTAADSGVVKDVYGVDLSTVVPEAIGIARDAIVDDPYRMVWAIPAGSTLGITGETLQNRMVYCGLHAFTLAGDDDGADNFGDIYATDDFREMFVRAVQWAGGQGEDGEKNPTAVQNVAAQTSDVMVYPNPAVDYATVKFKLDNQQMVSLNLFNVMGQKLEIQKSQVMTSGVKEIKFSTSALNRGLYIYQLNIGSKSFAGKLSITR